MSAEVVRTLVAEDGRYDSCMAQLGESVAEGGDGPGLSEALGDVWLLLGVRLQGGGAASLRRGAVSVRVGPPGGVVGERRAPAGGYCFAPRIDVLAE